MKYQVLSIEQMLHLRELGVDTSNASMVCIFTDDRGAIQDWHELVDMSPIFFVGLRLGYYDAERGDYDHSYRKDCGVFTLQDIIHLLPKEIKTSTDTYWLTISIYDCKEWYVCYSMSDGFDYYKEFKSKSLLDAAYEMLCWCAENGYIKQLNTKIMNYEEAKVDKLNRIIVMQSGEEISFNDKSLAKGSADEPVIFGVAVSRKEVKKFGMEIGISVFDVCDNIERYYYFTFQEAKILAEKLSKGIKGIEERESDYVVIDGRKYKLTEVVDSQD